MLEIIILLISLPAAFTCWAPMEHSRGFYLNFDMLISTCKFSSKIIGLSQYTSESHIAAFLANGSEQLNLSENLKITKCYLWTQTYRRKKANTICAYKQRDSR